MRFERSGNIALNVRDFESALAFYTQVMELPMKTEGEGMAGCKLESGLFYLSENQEWEGLVEEYYVDDIEAAKAHLLANGCEVIRWEGRGKDCYLKDPYGMMFNLWQREGD